jgi:sugar/nucleoside kinase (ribokinase family)
MADKLIVTRGPRGCEFQGRLYNVEPVDVKDTSGAGDTFVAALCYSYSNTQDIRKAIIYANHCSTKVVQKKGIAIV